MRNVIQKLIALKMISAITSGFTLKSILDIHVTRVTAI